MSNAQSRPLKIVHAAAFQLARNGAKYFNMEMKLQNGLTRLGHFSYPFSLNDVARMNSMFNSKKLGRKAENKALIETCRNLRPDLLLLGQAPYIKPETLQQCRAENPHMKVGMWYVEILYDEKEYWHIPPKIEWLDTLFHTANPPDLALLARPGFTTCYFPNPIDSSIETARQFEKPASELSYDLVFIGSDRHLPQRSAFLQRLQELLGSKVRFGIFGSLGNPPVFGEACDQVLLDTRMAINMARINIPLGSSDRLARLLGNGILTFTPRSTGLGEVFTEYEMVLFDDADDLAEQVLRYAADDDLRRATARAGWEKIHRCCAETDVARYMIEMTMNGEAHCPWPEHVFRG